MDKEYIFTSGLKPQSKEINIIRGFKRILRDIYITHKRGRRKEGKFNRGEEIIKG